MSARHAESAHSCSYNFTPHARRRQQQRGVSDAAVDAAIRWGTVIRQGGRRLAYHLGDRAVRSARRHGEDVDRYRRTVVIAKEPNVVLTVFPADRLARSWRKTSHAPAVFHFGQAV